MANRNKIYSLFMLFLLLCAAFSIRFKGIWFGYPLSVHPDEPILVDIALRMIKTGDLNPHFFHYPTLNIYFQAILYKIIQIFGNIFLDKPPAEIPEIWYYLVGRTFNVFLSVLTIIITYIIGKRLFSSLAGFLAAFFLTFSYLHIANSFLITTDISVAFWVSLVTLMAVLIHTEGKNTKYYILGGICVGLAISSKYTAIASVAPLLIAHYTQSCSSREWVDKRIIVCLTVIPVSFLITTPYALLDFNTFIADIIYEANHYTKGHPGAESSTSTTYFLYGKNLFTRGYGKIPMIFAGLGFLWLLRKEPWKVAIIAATPILLYLFVGRYKVYFPRNFVAAIPFLSLLSGAFLFFLYKAINEKLSSPPKFNFTVSIYLALAIALSGSVWKQTVYTIKYIEKITLPDTRWASLKWVDNNLLPGSRIGREHYTPPIEKYSDDFDVVYLGFIAVINNSNAMKNLDYMIVSSGDYGRYFWPKSVYPEESQAYLAFFTKHELVKEFIPDNKKLGGPRISIYRIRY